MVRVKICGITRTEDALAAARLGVDAIGLVFWPGSSRHVTVEQAAGICRVLPPFVNRVGLFMNAEAGEVREVLDQVALDWLQFHGQEEQAFCQQFGRPWIKALAMGGEQPDRPEDYPQADALLLDAHAPGQAGGSGQTFDWARIPALGRPWILAGGLTPDNVAAACMQLRPDAVDVSSGVEVSPGMKSDKLMGRFIKAARHG